MSRHWKGAPEEEPPLCPECGSDYEGRYGGPCAFCEFQRIRKPGVDGDILHLGLGLGLAQLLVIVVAELLGQ